MPSVEGEALAKRAVADAIVKRTTQELREILHDLVAQLKPFPLFPGNSFVEAIEAEPGRAHGSEMGCVVVCPDGELYEMAVEYDLAIEELAPMDDPRSEKMKPLELAPDDYIIYAHHAIQAVTEALVRQSRTRA
ncbi:MAG: hypothetical protein HY677_06175 [Chloroflexi bacterium]|nr:hypothetical protein [Chloroflexota bacterium]